MASDPPKVLISYSHDSPEHRDRSWSLASQSQRLKPSAGLAFKVAPVMENPLDPVTVGDRFAARPALNVPSPLRGPFWCSPSTSARTVSICTIDQYVVMPAEGWAYAPVVAVASRKPSGNPKSNCPRPLFCGSIDCNQFGVCRDRTISAPAR